jgi:hypothetical protein
MDMDRRDSGLIHISQEAIISLQQKLNSMP